MVSGIVLQLKQYRVAPGVALFQQIHPQIVTWSAPGQTLEPEDISLTRQALAEAAYAECAWALMLGVLLWHHGHRTPADFQRG